MVVNRLNTNVMDRKIEEVSLGILLLDITALRFFDMICMMFNYLPYFFYIVHYAVYKATMISLINCAPTSYGHYSSVAFYVNGGYALRLLHRFYCYAKISQIQKVFVTPY